MRIFLVAITLSAIAEKSFAQDTSFINQSDKDHWIEEDTPLEIIFFDWGPDKSDIEVAYSPEGVKELLLEYKNSSSPEAVIDSIDCILTSLQYSGISERPIYQSPLDAMRAGCTRFNNSQGETKYRGRHIDYTQLQDLINSAQSCLVSFSVLSTTCFYENFLPLDHVRLIEGIRASDPNDFGRSWCQWEMEVYDANDLFSIINEIFNQSEIDQVDSVMVFLENNEKQNVEDTQLNTYSLLDLEREVITTPRNNKFILNLVRDGETLAMEFNGNTIRKQLMSFLEQGWDDNTSYPDYKTTLSNWNEALVSGKDNFNLKELLGKCQVVSYISFIGPGAQGLYCVASNPQEVVVPLKFSRNQTSHSGAFDDWIVRAQVDVTSFQNVPSLLIQSLEYMEQYSLRSITITIKIIGEETFESEIPKLSSLNLNDKQSIH